MILRLLNWLMTLLPSRSITGPDGSVYLLRGKIWGWIPGHGKKASRLNIYLHRFFRPDADRHLHNHPWDWACSIVLAGGYYEEVRAPEGWTVLRKIKAPSIRFWGPKFFHRIHILRGRETWSLFITGKRIQTWGFFVDGRLIPSQTYLPDREEDY